VTRLTLARAIMDLAPIIWNDPVLRHALAIALVYLLAACLAVRYRHGLLALPYLVLAADKAAPLVVLLWP